MTQYAVTTFDNNEYSIDEEDAKDLIEAWKGSERSFPVDLGSATISSGSIKSITPRRVTEADVPPQIIEGQKRVEAGTRCRGQYSIQNEINKIAKASDADWGKKIKSKEWRAKVRERLLETEADWCDYKTGTCHCEPEFISSHSTFSRDFTA